MSSTLNSVPHFVFFLTLAVMYGNIPNPTFYIPLVIPYLWMIFRTMKFKPPQPEPKKDTIDVGTQTTESRVRPAIPVGIPEAMFPVRERGKIDRAKARAIDYSGRYGRKDERQYIEDIFFDTCCPSYAVDSSGTNQFYLRLKCGRCKTLLHVHRWRSEDPDS